jgi:hypothetical protein
VWTLGQIGVSVVFGAAFANLAPADLRGRFMGVASATWSVGAALGRRRSWQAAWPGTI